MSGPTFTRGRFERVFLHLMTVLAMGAGLVWVGSHIWGVGVTLPLSRNSSLVIGVNRGELHFSYDPANAFNFSIDARPGDRGPARQYEWMRIAFHYGLEPLFAVPLWMIFTALAAWPVAAHITRGTETR